MSTTGGDEIGRLGEDSGYTDRQNQAACRWGNRLSSNLYTMHKFAGEIAEAVVLGCTELPLILSPEESPLPILNTMEIHAEAAVQKIL